ncbi:MAG: energy-coupling factor ABC transporter ATP-binding protein [Peptococcaceae bacterium]|nr:energy-coupling factor ABC transporter ATP-binding protein [Peptococcaceae bacterium]
MITFKNFSFRYEEAATPTLQNLSFEIASGEFVLLTGRSGCGKTTLIRALNGLIPHFYPGALAGEILLDGRSLLDLAPVDLAGTVGTIFQDPRSQFFMTDTTRELAFGCENMGYAREETVARVAKACEKLSLTAYLNRSIFALSGGEKQQIAIGSVYALGPRVYIFDEPSANLDFQATRRLAALMARLKGEGCTIIVVEHRFYYLRALVDRVLLLDQGRIAETMTAADFAALDRERRLAAGLRPMFPEREIRDFCARPAPSQHARRLSVRHLAYAYKKGAAIFSDLSFEARGGEVIGILGHNGSGKTTLLSVLTGLFKETGGAIFYDGKALSPRGRRAQSYLVLQDTDYQLFAESVAEELSLGLAEDVSERVDEILRALSLEAHRDKHPAALSGGQKQRVTIGAAMVKESALLYFDEPTSGLDYDSMVRVSGLIKELAQSGMIIFVVTHDFEFIARTCSRVLMLDAAGAMRDRALSREVLEDLARDYFDGLEDL